ncbi:MAG: hypothetical protein H6707_09725 [Deltaproteobacteria bacterium]|nr:hypothetical protein [Deltaproteobacteria bacterium]
MRHLANAETQSSTAHDTRVAVVLNANARRVTPAIVRQITNIVGESSVFLSRSLEQASFIARHIVNRGYDTVLCGGGDGTFTRCVTDVAALRPARLPAFGILRLGTGNALADVLGAAKGRAFEQDIAAAQRIDSRVTLPLLRVDEQIAPFAGFGLDAMILEDYGQVKSRLADLPLGKFVGQGHAGYGLAIASRSVWRLMLEQPAEVTVRNDGLPAYPLGANGLPVGPAVERGDVIYRGPAILAGASTVPCFGFGVRIYPQVTALQDRFQLRLANVSAPTIVAKLPQVLSGTFFHPRVWDYACTAVTMEVANPSAAQIGGDIVGQRRQLKLRLTSVPAIAGPNRQPDVSVAAIDRADASQCAMVSAF